MALLGQGFDDPQSAAIMALAGGLLQKNFAGGLLGANNAYAQGKESQRRAAMDQMQMDMAKEDREFKRKAMELDARKKAEGQAFLRDLIGGGASYEPGQLGSGSFGAVGNADPMAAPTRRAGGLANVTPEQIAAAKAMYGYDLTEPWKVAKQGFELKPNSFRVDPATNRREYIGDPKEGYTYQNGVVGTMPGWLEAQTARTLATEGPKALLNSAAALNLRKNPDGTESPVSALSENPMLQGVLSNLFGGAPIPRAMPQGGLATQPPRVPVRGSGAGDPPSGSGIVAPQSNRSNALNLALQQSTALMNDQTLNAADRERATRDVADIRREISMSGGGAATAAITPGQGYGKTTAQETRDAAVKDATLKVNDTWLKNSYEPVRATGTAAGDLLTNITVARGALRNLGTTGWGTEAKASAAGILSGLGLAPAKVQQFATDAQTFQNAMATNLQTVLNAAKGPQTEGDSERASKTFAQLRNTPQANEFMLDLAQAKAERDAMRAQFYEMALPIARDKGDLTEVEREWIKRQPSVFTMQSMSRWGIK